MLIVALFFSLLRLIKWTTTRSETIPTRPRATPSPTPTEAPVDSPLADEALDVGDEEVLGVAEAWDAAAEVIGVDEIG